MRKIMLVAAVALIPVCAYAADAVVSQSHMDFDTKAVTIKAGENVTFTNNDDVLHNIQIIDANDDVDDRGMQKPKENDIKVNFPKAGEFKVRCSIHPKMKMTVTVQ